MIYRLSCPTCFFFFFFFFRSALRVSDKTSSNKTSHMVHGKMCCFHLFIYSQASGSESTFFRTYVRNKGCLYVKNKTDPEPLACEHLLQILQILQILQFCILYLKYCMNIESSMFYCWLVGCFGFNGPLRQYFNLRKRRERIDESKNVQTTPSRTYCKCSRPLSYCNPNCRTPRHWKFTKHHRTTRPPPIYC